MLTHSVEMFFGTARQPRCQDSPALDKSAYKFHRAAARSFTWCYTLLGILSTVSQYFSFQTIFGYCKIKTGQQTLTQLENNIGRDSIGFAREDDRVWPRKYGRLFFPQLRCSKTKKPNWISRATTRFSLSHRGPMIIYSWPFYLYFFFHQRKFPPNIFPSIWKGKISEPKYISTAEKK
jgi:hypothetical protein